MITGDYSLNAIESGLCAHEEWSGSLVCYAQGLWNDAGQPIRMAGSLCEITASSAMMETDLWSVPSTCYSSSKTIRMMWN